MQAFITKHKKGIKRMLIGCGIVAALGATVIFGMDVYVVHYAKGYVYETGQENSMPKADCILVLGAGMKPNGEPSLMLRDRLNRAIELYRAGVSDRFLLTGDHGRKGYNEVQGSYRAAARCSARECRAFPCAGHLLCAGVCDRAVCVRYYD